MEIVKFFVILKGKIVIKFFSFCFERVKRMSLTGDEVYINHSYISFSLIRNVQTVDFYMFIENFEHIGKTFKIKYSLQHVLRKTIFFHGACKQQKFQNFEPRFCLFNIGTTKAVKIINDFRTK